MNTRKFSFCEILLWNYSLSSTTLCLPWLFLAGLSLDQWFPILAACPNYLESFLKLLTPGSFTQKFI